MMDGQSHIYGGVLIGGSSTRMGRAKHLLELDGELLLARTARVITPFVDGVVVLGAGDLPEGCGALERLADVAGVRGPMAGMLAAMRFAPEHAWIFCPCDAPRVSAEAIKWLLGCRSPERSAVLPRSRDGRVEPLLAVYEPSACELLEKLIAEEQRAPRRLAQFDQVATPTIPDHLVTAWCNVNTPEDFQALSDAADGDPQD